MKKIYLPIFAMTMLLLASCSNDPIDITTTPKIRTLTYVVNTQSMYDELGLTSELSSNYLSKGYSIGVYTFIYDSNGEKVASKSSTTPSMGSYSEEFSLEEGSYTFVTYEALVGNGYTPSWSGDEKLKTLVFEDRSSYDYHFVAGKVQKGPVTIKGGNPTESATPEATKVLLTLNINLQSMYDEFGVTDDLTNIVLRDKNAPVGIFTYIYNSLGDLVDSVHTQQYSLNNATQIRSIPKGDYTILTVETLVDSQPSWKIYDTQKLTSVKMHQVYHNPAWNEVVGAATTNVNLTGNKEISITNKAIGSIVNFHAYNFENTSFATITFGTTDILDYYSFNPQLSREERFTKDLSESNLFTTRGMGMTPEESVSFYKRVCFMESKINWSFSVQYDAEVNAWNPWQEGNANLEDGKNYFAGFYYLYNEGNTYHFSTYFGDNEDDFRSWKSRWDDYIKNHNLTLFEEPYTTWEGSVASVKSFMSGYNVGNNGNLVQSDDNYILWYYGKYKEAEIDYYFTSPTGGLTNAVVFFDATEVGEDDLSKAFSEMGYELLLSDDNYSYYATKDMNSVVYVGLNNQNYWVVNYFSSSTSSAPKRNMRRNFPTFAPKQQQTMGIRSFDKKSDKDFVVNQLRQCENTIKFFK